MFQPSVHDLDLLRIGLILEEEGRREKKPLLQRIAGLFGMRPKNKDIARTTLMKHQHCPGLKKAMRILHRRGARSARW